MTLLAMAMVAAMAVLGDLPGGGVAQAAGDVPCATKRLHGQRLGIFLVEGNITCAKVRRIIRGAPATVLGVARDRSRVAGRSVSRLPDPPAGLGRRPDPLRPA
jgi:hypothetical protein